MQKDFIKQLQSKISREYKWVPGWSRQMNVDAIIEVAITNTGAELMKRAEGEKREQTLLGTPLHTEEYIRGINETLDTLKKHITNVTGVK